MLVDNAAPDRSAAIPSKKTALRARRWRQFSLRGLLVFTTAVAIGFGWLSMKAGNARRQRAAIDALGATHFYYDFQWSPEVDFYSWPKWNETAKPPGPAIIRWLWGEYVLANVVAMHLSKDRCKDLKPESVRNLAALNTLEYLDLSGQPIGDHDLDVLRTLPRLKRLDLSYTRISDDGLRRLSGMNELECLDVSGTKISGVGLAYLRECERLADLNIGYVPITQSGANALGKLTALQSLRAGSRHESPSSGDAILAGCARLKQLRDLSISGRRLTTKGVANLRGLPHLEYLDASSCGITDDALSHIAAIPSLVALDITSNNITDSGMPLLRGLDKLQVLHLGNNRITDAAIEQLSTLESLERLNLYDTLVSDHCVSALRNLPNLEWCNTNSTKVTPDGRKRMRTELPNLKPD